jgi:spore coat protein U-like protein
MSKFAFFLIILFFFFFMGEVHAANDCNITNVSNVNFSSYDPLSAANVDSTGSLTIDCTAAWTTVTTSIGPSPNSGVFNPRKMIGRPTADLLSYNLYTTASRNIIWGDGTQGTSTVVQSIQKNHPWTGTIYGRIPASQDVSLGNYSEGLMITISF